MNRVTFITGASSGLGATLAPLFAAAGDHVALIARRAERLESLADQIRKNGGTALPITCDVTDRAAVQHAVQQCESELGPVDLLIANAGVNPPFPARRFKTDTLERVFAVNVRGVAHCLEVILPSMIKRQAGHLVAISSLSAFIGLPGFTAYSASKAAVRNLMEGLRLELHEEGLAVTTVCPGFVKTEMTEGYPAAMPFLMERDEAAQRIYRAVERKDAEYIFPWPLAALVKANQFLPNVLTNRLARFFFKHR